MHIVKKIGLVIVCFLFGPFLTLSVMSLVFQRTLGNQAYVEQTVKESGLYQAARDGIVSNAIGSETAHPIIEKALKDAASPNTLERVFSPMISSTYAWLEGDIQQPNYALNLGEFRTNFKKTFTSQLTKRLQKLPACSPTSAFPSNDILDTKCLPTGTNIPLTVKNAVSRVMGTADIFTDEVLADGTLSAQEANNLGINVPTQAPPTSLRTSYQALKKGLPVFIIGLAASSAGIVLFSATALHGLRKLGFLLLSNGIGLLLLTVILRFILGSLVPNTADAGSEAAVAAVQEIAKAIIRDGEYVIRNFGIGCSVSGVIAVIVSTRLLRSRAKSA